MIITLICEPRSGSTNFANWFRLNKDFTVFNEPITNTNPHLYKGETSPREWKYETKHLLVKEILGNWENVEELLDISDKIIVLYRENEKEQIESWLHAKATNNWLTRWTYEKIENRTEIEIFKEYKVKFKKKFLTGKYFETSYEELYYRNGFQRVVDYLGIEGIESTSFPYGYKYRKAII